MTQRGEMTEEEMRNDDGIDTPDPSGSCWSASSLSPLSNDLYCVSGTPPADGLDDEMTGYEPVSDIDSESEGLDECASNISSQESEESENSDVLEDGVSDHDFDINENERGGLNNARNDSIEKFIMRTLKLKVKFGWSREETLHQLSNFYEYAQDDRIPHGDWQGVMKFLKGIGYDDPRVYKICCANDHVYLLEQEAERCPTCDKRKKCIDYYVLGINLKEMFSGDDYIKDILAHWENRESWFNLNENVFPKKEIWHGDRFKELSHFWDGKVKTSLPGKCPNCNDIISVSELEEFQQKAAGITGGIDSFNVECFKCGNSFMFSWKYMHGSPLNQAFIFHEDGFNSFNKKTRGIATIQLTSACTLKEKRSRGVSFQVYSFIPACYLSDGIVHKLDAFFKPLFDEIEALYLSGVSVSLPRSLTLESCTIPAGEHRVRALLLLGTADLKAHQDIALYAGGSYSILLQNNKSSYI
ncbi:hypothetical protein AC249_AIPGENE10997 [Exaiptasia diaphana]|nr:hypothetical protein AC249_AIPGENE10997 [Exaiptasia diaphana]